MAKIVKGAKMYLLFRGRDENGNDIVIDIFNKKELAAAFKEKRIREGDNLVEVEVLGRVNSKSSEKSSKS